MNYHAPWATLPEALQALNTVPLDPKTYDFIDQLTATYHAQPFDPASRFALVEMPHTWGSFTSCRRGAYPERPTRRFSRW